MALTTITKLFGIDDLKIFPITADTAAAYTLGSAIDIPGAKELSLDLVADEKELTGDEDILDVHTKIKKITFNASYAKMEMAALPYLIGGRITATGETQQRYSLQDGDLPGYFQMQALIKDVDTGSVTICLYKCKITTHPIGGAEDDYQTFSFSGSAIKTSKTFDRGSGSKKLLLDIYSDSVEQSISAITT